MRATVSAAAPRSGGFPAERTAANSSRSRVTPPSGALAEFHHVAVRIEDPELGSAEVAIGDAARVERAPHLRQVGDLERDVRIRRVDVVEDLRLLDQMELALAERVPCAGE